MTKAEFENRIGSLAARSLAELLNEGRPTRSGEVAQKVLCRLFSLSRRQLKSRLFGGKFNESTWLENLQQKGS